MADKSMKDKPDKAPDMKEKSMEEMMKEMPSDMKDMKMPPSKHKMRK